MRVLIVEDEKLLAESLKTLLERKGFTVETAFDGVSGAEYAETGIYDLLILDVMMPDMDGYAVARQVRQKRCTVPILMLTAKSDLPDRIEGLNAGADYYLTKPFDIVELLACIRALLRRQGGQVDRLVFGNTTLDLDADTLTCGEKKMRLSAKEFDVMRLLMQAGENNTPKESILTHVWGFDSDAVENNVEVYIRYPVLSTSRVRSAIGIISATLSGGVHTIACSPILRSKRTLSVIRSLSILLNASSNTTRRTVLPKLVASLVRYNCANEANTAM